jgi:hypothetical protein
MIRRRCTQTVAGEITDRTEAATHHRVREPRARSRYSRRVHSVRYQQVKRWA